MIDTKAIRARHAIPEALCDHPGCVELRDIRHLCDAVEDLQQKIASKDAALRVGIEVLQDIRSAHANCTVCKLSLPTDIALLRAAEVMP